MIKNLKTIKKSYKVKNKMKNTKNFYLKKNLFRKKIIIPYNVTLKKIKNVITFSGPLGSSTLYLEKLDLNAVSSLIISKNENFISICSSSKILIGCVSSLIKNKIYGVTFGFLIYLKILGVGYRAQIENNTLQFKLGYSHDILYKMPSSVHAFLLEPTLLCFYGIDKNQVTQTVAKIKCLKLSSVYKEKGFRNLDDKIILKYGKKK